MPVNPPARPHLLTTSLLVLLILGLLPPISALAAVGVSTGEAATYTEQDPPTLIGEDVTISGGTAYDGEYLDFEIGSAATDERLSLLSVATPSTTNGEVSIVDGAVYLGDGTQALPIGSVDGTYDGREGRRLRVNLTSEFANPGFEDGNLTAWSPLRQRIDLGTTSIAGHTSQDTSTYPGNTPNEDNNAPAREYDWTVEVTTDGQPTEGAYALRLRSSMTTAQSCDVVHGPAAYSSTFEAAAGDSIYFDWRAFAGSDAYHVFGYILDEHGTQTEVLDAWTSNTSGSTTWATKETVIPTTGTYRFVFVAGTYDATCARGAGAQLLIDNVRVFGSKVTDAVVTEIARKLQYDNTSDDPAATRTVTITAQSRDAGAASGDVTVQITPVDDPPSLDTPATVTFTNTADDDTFDNHYATLTATDPDSDAFTFDAAGATGGDWRVVEGTWSDLRVHTSGGFTVVPNDDAIDSQMTPASETFTVQVTADGQTDTAPLQVDVAIEASAPGAPTVDQITAGDSQVELSWTPDEWIGGSATSDHVVQYSTDGGTTWTTWDGTIGAATSATITGLEPGVPHLARVAAVNDTGTSDWSETAGPVTPQTHQDPLSVTATDMTYGNTQTLGVDGGSGTGAVSWRMISGPCTIDGDQLSPTTVGTCTVEATRDGDTTYYPAADEATVTIDPRPVTVTDVTVVDRQYDGTTDVDLRGATLAGVVAGDDVTLAHDTTGSFAQAGVGEDLTVTTSMTLGGTDASNYTLTQPTLTGTITARTLTVEGASVAPKVYDGTPDVIVQGATLVGVVDGEAVALADAGAGTLASAAAGHDIPVTTTMRLAGDDVANYVLTQPELTGRVGKRALQIVGAKVVDHTYDGTTAATITGARLDGVVDGDEVTLVDHRRGTFTTAATGTSVTVTTGMSATGTAAANYVVLQPRLSGTIHPREVTIVGAKVPAKVVDGTDTATIVGARLAGTVDSDHVTLTDATTGRFTRSGIGRDVPVRTAMRLTGTDAHHYVLAGQPTLSGDIVPAPTLAVGTPRTNSDEPAPVTGGDRVVTQLCNLQPDSTIHVTIQPDNLDLGTYTTDADGCALVTVEIPDTTEAGHRWLAFVGHDLAGETVTLTRDLTVSAATPSWTRRLSDTGIPLSRLLLFATSLLAVGAVLLRRGRMVA